MISGLPDRPLSYSEVESLAGSEALGFVMPATPESLRDDADGTPRVFDLLISTGETVSALVYDESDGWIEITKTDAGTPEEAAIGDIIAYRDYDIEDEETVREFVGSLYGTADELSESGKLEL